MFRIASADKLNDHYATYEIEANTMAPNAARGQIVLVRFGDEPPVPLPVTGVDPEKGTITVIGAARENGTDPGEVEVELAGPHGEITKDRASRVLCVGEGIGVGALVTRLEAYKQTGAYTIVVAGYKTASHIYWRELIDGLSDELYTVTADGSFGIKGPVRDTVKAICENVPDIERVVALGPMTLLKACARITEAAELPYRIGLAAVAEGEIDADLNVAVPDATYDWSRTELDGHKTDLDALSKQLGLHPAK